MTTPVTPAPQAAVSGAPRSVPTTPAPTTAAPRTAAPTTAAGKLAGDVAKALQVALAAEQVAVWAYDLVAAYDPDDANIIATIRNGHLARRDATAGLLTGGGAKAPIAAPGYSIPQQVNDPRSARALSATIEGDCAAAWRGVIGSTDSVALRTTALAGLSDSAVWLTTMKVAAKTQPATVAFPGGV
jgi:hypothetical protein